MRNIIVRYGVEKKKVGRTKRGWMSVTRLKIKFKKRE